MRSFRPPRGGPKTKSPAARAGATGGAVAADAACGGFTPTVERTVDAARISLESLTPRPGIREQYLPKAEVPGFNIRLNGNSMPSGAAHVQEGSGVARGDGLGAFDTSLLAVAIVKNSDGGSPSRALTRFEPFILARRRVAKATYRTPLADAFRKFLVLDQFGVAQAPLIVERDVAVLRIVSKGRAGSEISANIRLLVHELSLQAHSQMRMAIARSRKAR